MVLLAETGSVRPELVPRVTVPLLVIMVPLVVAEASLMTSTNAPVEAPAAKLPVVRWHEIVVVPVQVHPAGAVMETYDVPAGGEVAKTIVVALT